jgi:H+/Cl- antiporter ClcA
VRFKPRISRETVHRRSQRLVFIIGGLTVGGAAVLIVLLADVAQSLFRELLAIWPYAPLLITPLGFALCSVLTRHVFEGAEGSGIPQVIAARRSPDDAFRRSLVSLRIAFGKIVLLTLGLLCGASSGREGPTVQIGASIMFALGRLAPHRQPGFMLAGSAAGVAAAFNTPLAGIVFGIEEMSRSFEERTSTVIIGTVIAAGLTSLALLGNYDYFGTTPATLPFGAGWVATLLCGVLGGLLGGLFSRALFVVARGLPGAAGRLLTAYPLIFAALCGLGLALCGLLSGGSIFGTGYEQARSIIHGDGTTASWFFMPLKFVASVLSALSGIPGGIFSPSLSIGAGLGADVARLFTDVPASALALVGMVAFLTGVVQAPITAFVIVSEMTENHAMIIPQMLSALIANAASKLITPHGVYQALADEIIRKRGKETPPILPETARPGPEPLR